ncbi:hypothetical protein MRBLBA21_002637 [Peribacillus frigoritolerans]|uniref:hypothetical protein n=1 Tax=Peribacillus frigoritolerans TaxID=450367 RepID=UPI00342BF962
MQIPSEAAEFIDFYKTDRPYVYQVKIINKKQKTKFWWVNQGKAYNEQKMGGYLWAPQKSKQNRAISYHIDLLKAEVGDLVFCYSLQEVRSIGIIQKKSRGRRSAF